MSEVVKSKRIVTPPEDDAAVLKEVEAGTHGDAAGLLRDINGFLCGLQGKPGFGETQITTQRAIAEMWVREAEGGNKDAMKDLLRIRGYLKRDHWKHVGDPRAEGVSRVEENVAAPQQVSAPPAPERGWDLPAHYKTLALPAPPKTVKEATKTGAEADAQVEAARASYREVAEVMAKLMADGGTTPEQLIKYGIAPADAPAVAEKMEGIRRFLERMESAMNSDHPSQVDIAKILDCEQIFPAFAGDVRYVLNVRDEPAGARADRAEARAAVEQRMKGEHQAGLENNKAQEAEFQKLKPEVFELLMQAFKAGVRGHTKTEKEIERREALAKVRNEGNIRRAYDELNEYLHGLRQELQGALSKQREFDAARQAFEQLQIPVQDIAREVLNLELTDEKSYQRIIAPMAVVDTNALLLAGFKDEDVGAFTEAAFMVGARTEMRTNAIRGNAEAKEQFVAELQLDRFQNMTKELIRLVTVIDRDLPLSEGVLYTKGRILVTFKGSGTDWEISIPRDAARTGVRPALDTVVTHTIGNATFREMISWCNDNFLKGIHRIPLPRERRG